MLALALEEQDHIDSLSDLTQDHLPVITQWLAYTQCVLQSYRRETPTCFGIAYFLKAISCMWSYKFEGALGIGRYTYTCSFSTKRVCGFVDLDVDVVVVLEEIECQGQANRCLGRRRRR